MSESQPQENKPASAQPSSPFLAGLKAFWTGIPGILTALGGLIAAVAALVSALDKPALIHRNAPTLTPTLTATIQASPTPTYTLVPTAPSTFTAMPTSTAVPRSSQTPAAKPQATVGMLFQDDFASPSSGWDTESSGDVERGYKDGEYSFLVRQVDMTTWANPTQPYDWTDIAVDVDARRVGGPANNVYGVLVRYQPDDSFYLFGVSSDGSYAVQVYQHEEWRELVRWTTAKVVRQGEAVNHLRVECLGAQFRFYVNGVLVAYLPDSTFRSGSVGLLAGTVDEANAEIRFDNVRIEALGATAAARSPVANPPATVANPTRAVANLTPAVAVPRPPALPRR